MRSKKRIRDNLYDLVKGDPQRLRRIREIIQNRNLHKVLDEAAFSDFSLIIVIDGETPFLTKAKKKLEKLVEEIRVIVFESYAEIDKKKSDLIHCSWEL